MGGRAPVWEMAAGRVRLRASVWVVVDRGGGKWEGVCMCGRGWLAACASVLVRGWWVEAVACGRACACVGEGGWPRALACECVGGGG